MSPILTSNDGDDSSLMNPIINLTEETKPSGNRRFPGVSPLNLAKLHQATNKSSIKNSISDQSQAFNETKQGQKLQQGRLQK